MNAGTDTSPVEEPVGTVVYAVHRCSEFLKARDEQTELCNLWHVSQLAEVLPSRLVSRVAAKAGSSSSFRLRAEACYLLGRLPVSQYSESAKQLLKDEHPAVRRAAGRFLKVPPPTPATIEICDTPQAFWAGLLALCSGESTWHVCDEWLRTGEAPTEQEEKRPKVDEGDSVEKAVAEWAASHPHPDEPFLAVGPKSLSPLDIAAEVSTGSLIGKALRQQIVAGTVERLLGKGERA